MLITEKTKLVLNYLANNSPTYISKIARETKLPVSTVYYIVQRLARAGMVRLQRRGIVVYVELTVRRERDNGERNL